MTRKNPLLALLPLLTALVTVLSTPAQAAAPQVYEAQVNGVRTELRLVVEGSVLSGQMTESGIVLDLRGTAQGPVLQGQVHQPGGAALMRFDGRIDGPRLAMTLHHAALPQPAQVTFQRVGTAAPADAAPSTAPRGAAVDGQLVGRWHQQSMINSSGGAGGFASFTTQRTLELAADGQVRQWVRSVGGGAQWSHRSDAELEFSGRWAMQGQQLWVQPQGQPAFVDAGRAVLVDGRLVIYRGGKRLIWQR